MTMPTMQREPNPDTTTVRSALNTHSTADDRRYPVAEHSPEGKAQKSKRVPYEARERGGKMRLEVTVPVTYTLDEAAIIMAHELPQGKWRFGRKTFQPTLKGAAERGVSVRRARQKVDPDVVEHYRQQLVHYGLFPESELPTPDQLARKQEQEQQHDSDTPAEQAG